MRKVCLFALCLIACSNNGDTKDGGGGDCACPDGGSSGIKLTGVVSAYESKAVLPMATASITGGPSSVTASDGTYSLSVQKGTPFYLTVAGDQYMKLLEQEAVLSGDAKKDETLVRVSTQAQLQAFLMNFDMTKTKATLIIGVTKRTTCASSEGAIVDLEPPQPGSSRSYTQGGIPAANRTFAADGERIIFYNLDPKANVKIKLSWAMPSDGGPQPATPCTMVAYPFQEPDQPTLTYTGNVVLEAGDAFSYERLHLQ